nr:PTS glucose transporter subunit IIA [uncultured Butyricicoccus sp.]
MGFFKKKKKETILKAFATGKVIALKDVKDEMFSAGLMGPGIAIESDDGKYYSPVNGMITMLFPTKHALGLKSEDGQELLLHIGIDTVALKGEGFTAFVQDGQKVSAGDPLLSADLDFLRSKGLETTAILCITEPKEPQISFTAQDSVQAVQDNIATITL